MTPENSAHLAKDQPCYNSLKRLTIEYSLHSPQVDPSLKSARDLACVYVTGGSDLVRPLLYRFAQLNLENFLHVLIVCASNTRLVTLL